MIIGVIGGNTCSRSVRKTAYDLGVLLAKKGHTIVCGGLGGVMEAVSQGAKSENGLTIGILPGKNASDANKYIDIPIVTDMGYARNAIIVRTADVVVAVDGRYGTLSEIGLALACNKKVIGIGTWTIDGVIKVQGVEEAIALI